MNRNKLNNLKLFQAAIIVAIATLMGACSSSREATTAPAEIESGSVSEKFTTLAAEYKPWTQINVPVNVNLSKPKSISASGRAYMRRGEDIYISLRVLGIEVATFYANADSVYMTEKIGHRYAAAPISSLLNNTSLTISDLQDIILGRAFINTKGTIAPDMKKSVAVKGGADTWTITPKNKIAGAPYTFTVSNDGVLQSLVIDKSTYKPKCHYSAPVTTGHGTFMSSSLLSTTLKGKQFEVGLRWSWNSVKWEVGPSVGWREPKGYRKIELSQIMTLLGK